MNEWLGQVLLRANDERSSAFLGSARLIQGYELGRPIYRYHLGQQVCCNGPDGKGYCFDVGTGKCVMTWESADGGQPGNPACVQNSRGEWVHSSCLGLEPASELVAPVTRPIPPAAQYLPDPENPTSIPATEAPVLPAQRKMTRQALPTGDFPGPPFPVKQKPRPRPVLVAKTPAPMPEPCPLGPVPMARWVEGCMGIAPR